MSPWSKPAPSASRPAAKEPGTREPRLSVIAPGMRVQGELSSDGIVKIEGVVIGNVQAEHQVLVAKGGLVEGDILAREAILAGEVRGTIHAQERVEVQATSQIQGDIVTRRLVIQEGGEINGHIRMGAGDELVALLEKPGGKEADFNS